jgi:hypothetical protein
MILIERESDGAEGWTFDGWFLRPVRNVRGPLVFDGFDLTDYDAYGTRRWRFDGERVTLDASMQVLWQLDAGTLARPRLSRSDAWRWDGRSLTQVADARPDLWRATDEVPLLVIMFAACLL